MAEFHRIVVPTDFTEVSGYALDWAVALGARLGAAVTVMHAYEIPIISVPDGAVLATAEVASRIADAARVSLESAAEQRRGRGVPIDTQLREGAPAEEILRVADDVGADLVVIGTHGRRGLARALLGSVAEHVIRTSHRPVVTIRGPH